MKHIDLIIPTRNRFKKLERCLKSIPPVADGVGITVTVVCDGDPATADLLRTNSYDVHVVYVPEHSGSVCCRNLASRTVEDALLYATDDIEFEEGAITEAIKAMNKYFPDGDGVIGFNQVNARKFSKAGVALMGQRFLQRYPDRKFLYPGYFHFSCQEVERLGNKLGRIVLAEKARIVHYHPLFDKRHTDATHAEARAHKAADRELSIRRLREGRIWGDDGN